MKNKINKVLGKGGDGRNILPWEGQRPPPTVLLTKKEKGPNTKGQEGGAMPGRNTRTTTGPRKHRCIAVV